MQSYWEAGVAYGKKCYTAEWEILQRTGLIQFHTMRRRVYNKLFKHRYRYISLGIVDIKS